MFRNNLILVLRRLKKERLYTFVNVFGLTLGLSAFLLIALYVRDELSFDRFHSDHDQLYRVSATDTTRNTNQGEIAPDLAGIILSDISSVTSAVRLIRLQEKNLLSIEGDGIYADKVLFSDANFFEIFNFKLIEGTAQSVLDQPYQAVITSALSQKLFGEENPIGKMITLNKEREILVSGVCEVPPANSSIKFDMVVRSGVAEMDTPRRGSMLPVLTYLKIPEERNKALVIKSINELKSKSAYSFFVKNDWFDLLPIADQRLRGNFKRSMTDQSDIRYVTLFSGIGFVVLLLALINYVNLVTAQSMRRVKEIGLRKVIGANTYQLIFGQLFESIVITLISFVFAFAAAERVLPFYNALLDKSIVLQYGSSEFFAWVFLAGITLGLLAGLYPAFYISRFKPLVMLNRSATVGGKGHLRKFLILFQFVSSGVLLVVLVIMFSQMNYLKTKDLGFNPDFVVQIPIYSDIRNDYETLKNEIEGIGGVASTTVTGWNVGGGTNTSLFNGSNREADNTKGFSVDMIEADEDYLETVGLKFLHKAPDFDFGTLGKNKIVVNQALIKEFGWDDAPIGKRAYSWNKELKEIVAVVADFHTYSLKQEIGPLYISPLTERSARNILIKVTSNDPQDVLQKVGVIYEEMAQRPFEFYYLDDRIKAFYKKEQGQLMLFQVFSFLAVFISLLGLIALTIYMVEQRRKEVSIRKVLGASVQRLILMLNREYSMLVLLAFIIASPIAYYAMEGWLSEFKYRIPITPFLFVGAFLGFLALSWLVTLFQSLRVSSENPADVLREE